MAREGEFFIYNSLTERVHVTPSSGEPNYLFLTVATRDDENGVWHDGPTIKIHVLALELVGEHIKETR
jgi:hypothetical protein